MGKAVVMYFMGRDEPPQTRQSRTGTQPARLSQVKGRRGREICRLLEGWTMHGVDHFGAHAFPLQVSGAGTRLKMPAALPG